MYIPETRVLTCLHVTDYKCISRIVSTKLVQYRANVADVGPILNQLCEGALEIQLVCVLLTRHSRIEILLAGGPSHKDLICASIDNFMFYQLHILYMLSPFRLEDVNTPRALCVWHVFMFVFRFIFCVNFVNKH